MGQNNHCRHWKWAGITRQGIVLRAVDLKIGAKVASTASCGEIFQTRLVLSFQLVGKCWPNTLDPCLNSSVIKSMLTWFAGCPCTGSILDISSSWGEDTHWDSYWFRRWCNSCDSSSKCSIIFLLPFWFLWTSSYDHKNLKLPMK